MKVVEFDGKYYEVIEEYATGKTKAYVLKADFTRNKGYKFPEWIPTNRCKPVDTPQDKELASRRKIEIFIAGLSFSERMILQREICQDCNDVEN